MSQTLISFIATRRAELDKLEAPIQDAMRRCQQDLDAIQVERQQLDAAQNAVSGLSASLVTRRQIPEMTIKDAVLKVLHEKATGLGAVEILELINAELGTDYARASLSPQLSRLKHDGKIALDGRVWRLAGFGGALNNIKFIEATRAKSADLPDPENSADDIDPNPEEDEWGDEP